MSIDSVNQTAASSYLAQKTGTNPSAQTGQTRIEFVRALSNVMDLTEAQKASASGRTTADGQVITILGMLDLSNIPTLSETGLKMGYIYNGYSSHDEMKMATLDEDELVKYKEIMEFKSEYRLDRTDFDNTQMEPIHQIWAEIRNNLNEIAGTNDTIIELTPTGIKFLDAKTGAPYPLTEELSSYLKEAKITLDQAAKIQRPRFMSFDEWKLENLEET